MKTLLVIRIAGQPDLTRTEKEALFRLRLRRKYAAVLVKPTAENTALLQQLRNLISYGEISQEVLAELLHHRAMPNLSEKEKSKKMMERLEKGSKEIAEELINDKKSLKELGFKPFFRLHPPRGGIEAKKHAGTGKGVLGRNQKIDELVRRML